MPNIILDRQLRPEWKQRRVKADSRSLIQRVKDLLVTNRRWTKNTFKRYNAETGVYGYCLIGGFNEVARTKFSPTDNVVFHSATPGDPQTACEVKDAEMCVVQAIIDLFPERVPRSSRITWEAGKVACGTTIITNFNDHLDTTEADLAKVLDAAQEYDVIAYAAGTSVYKGC